MPAGATCVQSREWGQAPWVLRLLPEVHVAYACRCRLSAALSVCLNLTLLVSSHCVVDCGLHLRAESLVALMLLMSRSVLLDDLYDWLDRLVLLLCFDHAR